MGVALEHGVGTNQYLCWRTPGSKPLPFDLLGSGIDPTDPNRITSLAQYLKPLLELLKRLGSSDGHEKVILVGHSIGSACISHAMECFPELISKAIFVSVTLISNNQSAFDILAKHVQSPETLMAKAQVLIYGNGRRKPPTAITFDKNLTEGLFFNTCPAKDVALSTHSMRPTPFAPTMEKLSLTHLNYGTVRRFYISTTADQAFPFPAQLVLIEENPPERVYTLRDSDHCPFLSKPQSLHRVLLRIAHLNEKC
uniref:AB hydrolase-1 domain-containing protein n=1 Tax=Physcomitrium patens TaxID=3218 RepID=A0A2K1IU70_PHYPA|nr:hypothetical protein PHYPA_024769 [Physcomitrium patens]